MNFIPPDLVSFLETGNNLGGMYNFLGFAVWEPLGLGDDLGGVGNFDYQLGNGFQLLGAETKRQQGQCDNRKMGNSKKEKRLNFISKKYFGTFQVLSSCCCCCCC